MEIRILICTGLNPVQIYESQEGSFQIRDSKFEILLTNQIASINLPIRYVQGSFEIRDSRLEIRASKR